ncbi:MAG: pitrilysin family protein [Wenzhouxiangellaceae bacterium]
MLRRLTPYLLLLTVHITALAETPEIDLPYETFTLNNGLRVVVHEDRKAPVVAVSVWYRVGSMDEQPGKTGFAHLFEHLMFNGSENYDGEFFAPFEQVGATGMNGTTWFDRTNYYETVPTPALDMALWMESDRMGHLLGAIDQDKLDEQRGVVQNEKRQGDNQPYGLVEYRILEGLFPMGHPYRWSTIGSMDDLNAASLEDVKQWFSTYYGAANAVIALAGDIDAATARPLMEKYFGDIESGPPLARRQQWVPELADNVEEHLFDRVPQARLYRVWAVPGRTEKATTELMLAARILGGGKTSRLYQALVEQRQLATSVSVSIEAHQLASMLNLTVTLTPGASMAEVKAVVDEEIAAFLKQRPDREALERAITGVNAGFIRGLEQVGGFSGKASMLAQGLLYADDAGFYPQTWLSWVNQAEAKHVRETARQWLNKAYYQLEVMPYPDYQAAADGADRSALPEVGALPNLDFPAIERAQLSNGIQVQLARRQAVPVVQMSTVFDAGYAADAGGILGLSGFTLAMMDEGTSEASGRELAERAEALGAVISTGSSLDQSTVQLSALKPQFDESVELYADIIRNPAFNEADLQRERGIVLARIQQEKAQPVNSALRLLPPLLYGDGHAYGIPLTGSGTEASVNSIGRDDLVDFHQRWIRPANATIMVSGDIRMDELLPVLERHLGDWRRRDAELPEKNIAPVALPENSILYVLDKPGSPQSVIIGGHVIAPTGDEHYLPFEAMNEAFGGAFSARLNMNLREDKGWAYGAYTFTMNAQGQRPWLVYAPVQSDRTADAIAEIQRELTEYRGERPVTEAELEKVINNNVNSLPGQFETSSAVLGAMVSNWAYQRADDYYTDLPQRYRALSIEQLARHARQDLHPDRATWVVVGDRAQIESSLQDLGFDEIRYIDADGQLLE